MNNIFRRTALLCLISIFGLCGCNTIPEVSLTDSSSEESSSEPDFYIEYEPEIFDIGISEFITKINASDGAFENAEIPEGEGYVQFQEGGKLGCYAEIETPQHYRVVLSVRSESGAAIKLKINEKTEGMFYVNSGSEFDYEAVDCVYLAGGRSEIALEVCSGTADIDCIIIENSESADYSCYRTETASQNQYASLGVIGAMNFFSDIYGTNSLTAANVTLGTNAEIDEIYSITGRYPAIRGSQLAFALSGNAEKEQLLLNDIALAEEWSKNGGIVSYKWHWYSPNELRSVKTGDFDLRNAIRTADIDKLSTMTSEEIKALYEKGEVTAELCALISDIDKVAQYLLKLKYKDVVTIFEPVPNADSGLYWWGDDKESFKKLYALLFDRLCNFHRLSNLIFVYNGNAEYYPGAQYCDIIGQSFNETSDSAFAGRFLALAKAFPTKKMLAVTACDVMPKADYMSRDNAFWLWTALESGAPYTDEELNAAYYSTIMLTRDELPDINDYALREF